MHPASADLYTAIFGSVPGLYLALRPDLVVTYASQGTLQSQLTRSGIRFFDYRHAGLAGIFETMQRLGVATGRSQDAERVIAGIRAHLDRATNGQWANFPSPGEGADWRLEDDQLTGAALIWEDSVVVHLQLFPKPPDSSAPSISNYRPHIRRRYGSPPVE